MIMAACHSYKQLFYLLITAALLSYGSQKCFQSCITPFKRQVVYYCFLTDTELQCFTEDLSTTKLKPNSNSSCFFMSSF